MNVFCYVLQIDTESVTKLGHNDEVLSNYLCIGDRVALRDFVAKKGQTGTETARSDRKRKCYDAIRKRLKLSKDDAGDADSDGEKDVAHPSNVKRSNVKMIGNQNAVRMKRTIEFGWYHNGINVRKSNGGGTRKTIVNNTDKKVDLVKEGQVLFFPGGKCRTGVSVHQCTFNLCDFSHQDYPADITVGTFYEEVKMSGKMRFNMYSEGPAIRKKLPEAACSQKCQDNLSQESDTEEMEENGVVEEEVKQEEVVIDGVCWQKDTDISYEVQFGPSDELFSEPLSDTLPYIHGGISTSGSPLSDTLPYIYDGISTSGSPTYPWVTEQRSTSPPPKSTTPSPRSRNNPPRSPTPPPSPKTLTMLQGKGELRVRRVAELIQQCKYALDAMAEVVREPMVANLPDPRSVMELYDSKKPTIRKVLKLLQASPEDVPENTVLGYTKQLIRGFSPLMLVRFLQFVTGARQICVDKISIHFNKKRGLMRAPMARTCGPVLELSSTYSNFQEFRSEFNNILSGHSGEFDTD